MKLAPRQGTYCGHQKLLTSYQKRLLIKKDVFSLFSREAEMVDKPRVRSRFRDRSIPAVARRLKMPEHELRRAAQRGEVKVFSWGGLDRISPVEEARIEALLQENAT
jgi:hypothetical protein